MSEMAVKILTCFAVYSLVGWILLFTGIGSKRDQRRREERERARATGRVAEYVKKTRPAQRRNGPREYFLPVIEFTAEERAYRLEYTDSLDQGRYPVGETVEVLYDPDHPERFHLEEDLAFSRGGSNIVRFGAIWIVVSFILTMVLAVFVGGYAPDVDGIVRNLRNPFAPRPKVETVQLVEADGGFQYEVQSDINAVITGYTGKAAELTLPLIVDSHVVTGFTSHAFARANTLMSLTVPGHFSKIPMAAFAGCLSLNTVNLREGVKDIGKLAFNFCLVLEDVWLPESLEHIDDDVFPDDCKALFHVVEGSYAHRYCVEQGFSVAVDYD